MSSADGPAAARDDVPVRRENGILIVTINRPQPAPAPRLSVSAVIEGPGSRWCGHTDQILAEPGYPPAEIEGMRAAGQSPSGAAAAERKMR
jgi:hypothetical protein